MSKTQGLVDRYGRSGITSTVMSNCLHKASILSSPFRQIAFDSIERGWQPYVSLRYDTQGESFHIGWRPTIHRATMVFPAGETFC